MYKHYCQQAPENNIFLMYFLTFVALRVKCSIATGSDDPDGPGQTGRILSGSLGYLDLTKKLVYPV